MENIQKFENVEKRFLYMPLAKSASGKYEAVLTSVVEDRDEEIVGKRFMEKTVEKNKLPALMDHENKVLNLVAKWIDMSIGQDDEGNDALIAVPKFFNSNPNAQIIKGMLDEGAEIGVSITAIPKSFEYVEKNGRKLKQWTDGEIVSADFVGIPANQYARARAIAKSFMNKTKNTESDKVTPEDKAEILKELSAELEKKLAEALSKALEGVQKNFSEGVSEAVKTALPELEKKLTADVEKKLSESMQSIEKKQSESREEALEKLNKAMPSAESMKDATAAPEQESGISKYISAQKRIKA